MVIVESTPVMRKKIVQELLRLPMFASLNMAAQMFLVDSIEVHRFEKVEFIFRQGDTADSYILLLKGMAKLCMELDEGVDSIVIGSLKRLQGVGELGLLTQKPRALSLIAEEGALILVIKKNIFLDLFERFGSFSSSVAKSLASSLQSSRPKIPLEIYDGDPPDDQTLSLLPLSFVPENQFQSK